MKWELRHVTRNGLRADHLQVVSKPLTFSRKPEKPKNQKLVIV
nr:MAG TPA: hypothetical protein [Caudoviricetes sp.]